MQNNKKFFIKAVSIAVLIIVLIFITILCIPIVRMLATPEGREGLENLVDKNIVLGLAVYLFLQVLQVVVALIPGGVIQILG